MTKQQADFRQQQDQGVKGNSDRRKELEKMVDPESVKAIRETREQYKGALERLAKL